MPLMARMDAAGEAPAPAPARRPIVPSPQQAAFLTHVEGSDSHVLLEARAGSGKSTTCRGRAESMFSDLDDRNAVVLSSVHRAKGLEADTVVILRPDLLPGPWAETPQDVRQERNCLYVAATRSRRLLAFAGGVPAILRD